MKKSIKSTTASKAQTPRNQRCATNKSKPVTIDLKAEKKVKKSAATAAASPAVTAKTTSKNNKQSDVAEKSNFGRNASPAGGNPSDAKTSAKSPQEKKPRKSSGRTGRFAAALVGGGVALGGAGLLQYAGILPAPNQSNPAALQQQVAAETDSLRTELAALTSRLNSVESSTLGVVNGVSLATQIEAIVSQRLAEQPPAEGDARLDAVITQVNETTLRVEKLLADQQTSTQTLSEFQSAISSGAADGGAAVSALALQIENLASGSSKLSNDLDQLKAEIATLANQLSSQSSTLSAELENRLAEIKQQAQTMTQLSSALDEIQSAITANNKSLQQQSENVDRLTASLKKPNSSEKLAARVVAAAALKNDIARGLPFEASLQMLQNLSADDTALEPLAIYAQSSIPTIAQLTTSFATKSDAILAASEPAPGENLLSRLLAGVKFFVKVKPRKALEGSTPIAVVSQISQSLRNGDLVTASDLWKTLPDAGRDASSDWHGQLQSRITTNDLISSSVQSFLNSTATQ